MRGGVNEGRKHTRLKCILHRSKFYKWLRKCHPTGRSVSASSCTRPRDSALR